MSSQMIKLSDPSEIHISDAPSSKAYDINRDFIPGINYRGAISEIGAGQEAARHFFEAYKSANTIVKTMSAFGKGCSNAIYGPAKSYVTEQRLIQMIDHDYDLLIRRDLDSTEKPDHGILRYFVLANTIDLDRGGWIGVRVQTSGNAMAGPDNHHARDVADYVVHFNLLGRDKHAKMNATGHLSVNLLYGAILRSSLSDAIVSDEYFVRSLRDGIAPDEIRIDMIEVWNTRLEDSHGVGRLARPEMQHEDDVVLSTRLNIELLKSESARVMIFGSPARRSACPTYDAFAKGEALLLAQSALTDTSIELVDEMLECARTPFCALLNKQAEAAGIASRSVSADEIRTAVQVPLLSPGQYRELKTIYINRERETAAERRSLSETDVSNAINRVDGIVHGGHLALLTEFSEASELLKILRTPLKSRLGSTSYRDIAFVFRADQFVELLLGVKHKIVDRDPVEILGSIVRRRCVFFIYPCSCSSIMRSHGEYEFPAADAFTTNRGRKWLSAYPTQMVNVERLIEHLDDDLSSVVNYMKKHESLFGIDGISMSKYTGHDVVSGSTDSE